MKGNTKKQEHPQHIKIKVWNSCMLPVLTYGRQTWVYKYNLKGTVLDGCGKIGVSVRWWVSAMCCGHSSHKESPALKLSVCSCWPSNHRGFLYWGGWRAEMVSSCMKSWSFSAHFFHSLASADFLRKWGCVMLNSTLDVERECSIWCRFWLSLRWESECRWRECGRYLSREGSSTLQLNMQMPLRWFLRPWHIGVRSWFRSTAEFSK